MDELEEKNRFSKLLEQLMNVAELKNYTLAQELQYDVSYISKWVSGRMIPAEKTEKTVLRGIARCIAQSASPDGMARLMRDYSVMVSEELEEAVYDNLVAEYDYVRDLQKNYGAAVAPKTVYYPELLLPQYVAKMHHPVLRRVKSLDVMAAMDILSMEHDHRLQIITIENEHLTEKNVYPDVHFSMLINLDIGERNYTDDTLFLLHMMTNVTHFDFKLYGSRQAFGRAVFAVKDDFAISGMLVESNRCISVTVSEEPENCNKLYRNVKALCSQEQLLFRQTSMREMLSRFDYIHMLLSPGPRWMLGHMTEHFLPDDLFEELAAQLPPLTRDGGTNLTELHSVHSLSGGVIREASMELLFYESAFSELAVSGEIDFFGKKMRLAVEQRLRLMEYVEELLLHQENLQVRLVNGCFVTTFKNVINSCIFLSAGGSYLRLSGGSGPDGILVVNRADMQNMLDHFFAEIWDSRSDVVMADREEVIAYVRHVIQGIRLIAHMEETMREKPEEP